MEEAWLTDTPNAPENRSSVAEHRPRDIDSQQQSMVQAT
jgi:hypothetical protein